jgi:DUF4097 and DUF4098 domain-containing protein YvlB
MRVLLLAPMLAAVIAALPAGAEVREEFHKSVLIDADGSFSLKNINGDISVSAWERNEVEIDAVKTANSEQKLHEARIEIEGGGHSVKVETKYPEYANDNPAKVVYTIHLPRGARLFDVRTVNGEIHIDGPQGRIKAATVNGSLEVWNAGGELELGSVNGDVKAGLSNAGVHRVKLSTVNGNLAVSLPAASNVRVKASTVHGDIHSDLPLNVEKSKHAPGVTVDSNLGSGGDTLELGTVNGSIYLHKS